jgi:hypothetical protein
MHILQRDPRKLSVFGQFPIFGISGEGTGMVACIHRIRPEIILTMSVSLATPNEETRADAFFEAKLCLSRSRVNEAPLTI